MKFDLFLKGIPKIKNLPLPGPLAHLKMLPKNRIKEFAALKNETLAKKAAVMALFYPNKENETILVLILRKTYKGVHSNQVAFPGGKVEKEDQNYLAAALRETHEEIGVPSSEIESICALSSVFIPPSNFMVYPFMGIANKEPAFRIQEEEVAEILKIPLSELLSEENVSEKELATSYSEKMTVPVLKLEQQVVWGATAMMLSEIKMLINQSR